MEMRGKSAGKNDSELGYLWTCFSERPIVFYMDGHLLEGFCLQCILHDTEYLLNDSLPRLYHKMPTKDKGCHAACLARITSSWFGSHRGLNPGPLLLLAHLTPVPKCLTSRLHRKVNKWRKGQPFSLESKFHTSPMCFISTLFLEDWSVHKLFVNSNCKHKALSEIKASLCSEELRHHQSLETFTGIGLFI